jgi:hypothetical protein
MLKIPADYDRDTSLTKLPDISRQVSLYFATWYLCWLVEVRTILVIENGMGKIKVYVNVVLPVVYLEKFYVLTTMCLKEIMQNSPYH